jgi:membrane peptidoglycan carboxypeptidase
MDIWRLYMQRAMLEYPEVQQFAVPNPGMNLKVKTDGRAYDPPATTTRGTTGEGTTGGTTSRESTQSPESTQPLQTQPPQEQPQPSQPWNDPNSAAVPNQDFSGDAFGN